MKANWARICPPLSKCLKFGEIESRGEPGGPQNRHPSLRISNRSNPEGHICMQGMRLKAPPDGSIHRPMVVSLKKHAAC